MTAKRTDALQPGDRVELGTFTVSAVVTAVRRTGPISLSVYIDEETLHVHIEPDRAGRDNVHQSRLWITHPDPPEAA